MVAPRSALLLTFTVGLLSLTGCRLCTNCEDEAYPTYGGIWQRTDRFHGRVGSIFEPAGAKIDRVSSVSSDEAMDYEETADGGNEDEFEALPPGDRRPGEDRSIDDAMPSEEESPNGLGEAETEEVRLHQPFGNPGSHEHY